MCLLLAISTFLYPLVILLYTHSLILIRLINHGDRELYVSEYLRFLFTEPEEKQAVHFIKVCIYKG